MQEYAIIVAGGSGNRMKSDIPKQFIKINGLPILMHTINAFRKYSETLNIILVLPNDQMTFWTQLCEHHLFSITYTLVAGGDSRFSSVKNGLKSIQENSGLVAVHDGVRPIISNEIIAASFAKAAENGSAVTSVPLKDSIRKVDANGDNAAMDRNDFQMIQTPQTFRLDWMRKAFETGYSDQFTDCASVLEAAAYPIHLIPGSYENIKITTPEDLRWAEIYLKNA
ncbi:2-C-methyl-D-erythritol 4-phosphate cytidylyltransferase [Dyadobacter sp. CY107]|uniref:2-C-methyl-D-erythritol 4-phosphate cytidylyltransferase n=1 Tax=Dyadobacter fanqingshengii TaxID=2906443 RepID=UPI001F200F75|nr:2-C-methyl-D-erythritol 4-phosphate cytidylyltransferase [Dyadobacter fanqingshengii]MCF2506978.1 2-C-methyl-D-erythritol 4-phosphate cytidylyltransferase [Dyadobacter fanqingshengii]